MLMVCPSGAGSGFFLRNAARQPGHAALQKPQLAPAAGRTPIHTLFTHTLFAARHRHDKARENTAALEVLPDLLAELDEMAPPQRLLALLQVGRRTLRCRVSFCCRGTVQLARCGMHAAAQLWRGVAKGTGQRPVACTMWRRGPLAVGCRHLPAPSAPRRLPAPPPPSFTSASTIGRACWPPTSSTGVPRRAWTCTTTPPSWRCTERFGAAAAGVWSGEYLVFTCGLARLQLVLQRKGESVFAEWQGVAHGRRDGGHGRGIAHPGC